jgi:hypothetical protein
MQLLNLRAGEYSATLPFHAVNVAIAPSRFTFTANVKHHWGWAVLCVSLALLLSFGASKLVDIRNERLRLAKRIEQLSPKWLENEEETVAMVWVISIVTQTSAHSRTWFLPSLETVHARLDKVEALLQPIASLRRARSEIERSQALPALAKTRALTMVRRIAEGLDPDMDQALLSEQMTAITGLRDWTRGDPARPYAADLAVSVSQLLGNVDVAAIPRSGQAFVRSLVDELKSPLPTTLPDLKPENSNMHG